MNPLTQERLVIAALAAATALLLAAPANGNAQTPVVPDAVDRAVAAQSTADDGPTVLRKSGTKVVVAEQPAWLKALEARSHAMNDFYGITATTSVRPDDRAVPRPVAEGPAAAASPASGGDGREWGDVAMGALGGFGIGLFLISGTLLALRSRRHDGGVALP